MKQMEISIGPCQFCDWKPELPSAVVPKLYELATGEFVVMCPTCGLELPSIIIKEKINENSEN